MPVCISTTSPSMRLSSSSNFFCSSCIKVWVAAREPSQHQAFLATLCGRTCSATSADAAKTGAESTFFRRSFRMSVFALSCDARVGENDRYTGRLPRRSPGR
jgi:hypothetical protein